MTGWPTDQVFTKFKEAIDSREQVVIIILDEIDKLIKKGDDVLYNLSRINTDLRKAKVSMIGVSNDLKFTEFLDPRVKSSLGEEELIFPPYDAEQISDILKQRAKMAYNDGILGEMVIPLCAAFAAQEHGDARRALDLLRVSGEIADRENQPQVLEEHVRRAQEKIEIDRVVEVVRTLPTQSKLVLYSIILLRNRGREGKNVTTGEMYNVYRQLCHHIDVDILTQRRVTDLMSELDMLGIVNAVVVSKGRYGRTKEISLSVPVENTRKVLLEDYRLKPLVDFKTSIFNKMFS
jgi:cell division control protein 6